MLMAIGHYSNYHVGVNRPEQDEEDVNDFSIVYETSRRWDKALAVYESLSECPK